MKKVIRYKCDYCKKIAIRPNTIEAHEKVCINNPEGKNCYMCEMSYLDDYEEYHEYSGTYSDFKNQCMCVYTDEVVSSVIGPAQGNEAPKCPNFHRSENGYWERNREMAEANYEKYIGR